MKESFATTHWSLVLAAGKGAAAEAQNALAALCQTYWYPLYAYVRRQGHQPDDAQDLTQAFFAQLLEKHYLQSANPERGRFRSFLLTALKRFVSKEQNRERAKKRGGGRKLLPLDFEAGERQYNLEPAHEATAEKIYEQRWALTLLDRVFARLGKLLTGSSVPGGVEEDNCAGHAGRNGVCAWFDKDNNEVSRLRGYRHRLQSGHTRYRPDGCNVKAASRTDSNQGEQAMKNALTPPREASPPSGRQWPERFHRFALARHG